MLDTRNMGQMKIRHRFCQWPLSDFHLSDVPRVQHRAYGCVLYSVRYLNGRYIKKRTKYQLSPIRHDKDQSIQHGCFEKEADARLLEQIKAANIVVYSPRRENLLFVAPTINQKEHKKGSRHLVAQIDDEGGFRCPMVPLPQPPQTGQRLINLTGFQKRSHVCIEQTKRMRKQVRFINI